MKILNWLLGKQMAKCIICGAETDDPASFIGERSFCRRCSVELSKLRVRKKGDPQPGKRVEYVILVGFDRMPTQDDVSALGADDQECRGTILHTMQLGGGYPSSGLEVAMIVADLTLKRAREKLGHDIDWAKVTYEAFKGLVVVKYWI